MAFDYNQKSYFPDLDFPDINNCDFDDQTRERIETIIDLAKTEYFVNGNKAGAYLLLKDIRVEVDNCNIKFEYYLQEVFNQMIPFVTAIVPIVALAFTIYFGFNIRRKQ